MTRLNTLALALGLAATFAIPLAVPALADEKPADSAAKPAQAEAAQPKCRKAMVNPVTGFAFCLEPKGVPVDPPPVTALKPCKSRPHDKETGAVYEKWSGCW